MIPSAPARPQLLENFDRAVVEQVVPIVGLDEVFTERRENRLPFGRRKERPHDLREDEVGAGLCPRFALGQHRVERIVGMAAANRLVHKAIGLKILRVVVEEDVADVEEDPVDHASLTRSIRFSIIHRSHPSCSSVISSSEVLALSSGETMRIVPPS